MFAAYGQLSFEVIASPTKYEVMQKYHYGKLDVIGAPPILQWIYDDLAELKLEIMLHSYWCDCQAVLELFQEFAESHVAQPLVFGNGINVGNFVIQALTGKHIWQADDGSIIATTLTLDLLQYVGPVADFIPSELGGSSAPPGLTTSQTSSPGSAIITAPATAAPSGIPSQTPYTAVPASTIVRGY